jgi:hypothetical protein
LAQCAQQNDAANKKRQYKEKRVVGRVYAGKNRRDDKKDEQGCGALDKKPIKMFVL